MHSVPRARPRAILYDRVSTVMQSKVGYSGGADGFQLEACRARADARAYEVVGEITDVDSGAKWNIDGIMAALDRAKRREYDVLLVSDTSRFARSLAKKTVYEADLRRNGVRVEYLSLPDTDDAEGRFVSNVFGALDELERERIAHRTKNGRHQKAAAGKVVGSGPPPYGYRYVTAWSEARKAEVTVSLAPDPATRPVVERVYRERIAGQSPQTIADRLTADGIPTPGGWTPTAKRPRTERWSRETVRRILGNSVYRGAWRYGDEVVAVEPIVAERDWQAARRPSPGARRTRCDRDAVRAARWTLRGRLTCGHCGGALSTDDRRVSGRSARLWPAGKVRRYLCARSVPCWARRDGHETCPLPGLLASHEATGGRPSVGLEDLAWAFVSELILAPGAFEAKLSALTGETAEARAGWERRLGDLDAEIAKQERRRRRAGDEMVDLERDDERYAEYAEREAAAVAALRTLRAERGRYVAAGGPGLSEAERAAVGGHVAAVRATAERALGLGLAAADDGLKAELYRLLRLEGTVTPDPDGRRVGRDATVRVSWRLFVDSGCGVLKLHAVSTASGLRLEALAAA